MFILMISYDFCLLAAQFCYIIVYILKVENCVHIVHRCAPWKISDAAQNLVSHALQILRGRYLPLISRQDKRVQSSLMLRPMVSRPVFLEMKHQSWAYNQIYYCRTVTGLLMWGALSNEKTGLSFTIAASPRQRSRFRFQVPWDSRPYFTVSDSRLPFLTPPTTLRATVEVFDPASTRDRNKQVKVKVTLRLTVSQSVTLGIELHLGPMTRYLFLSNS
jgi:hypothetical protein